MYSRLGTVVAILMAFFPFFALGWKMFEDSAIGIGVYGAIVVILLMGLLIAPRLKLADAGAEASAERAASEPAPPIEWSWDGTNRQPGDDKE